MIDKITAQKRISDLVTRFEEQYASYKNSNYNETQTRRDFIDPFFKALGWDIDNEEGYAEAYREVIHEDKVKVSGATKAPDYSFRLVGGKRLFFVEAKKPSVSVKDDIQPAYQIRRYGWSAKHPISIITDFEEFAIYDCTKKPKPDDKPSVARIKYITYQDYIKEFDFIWETFSKEQVLKGSFDKFIQSDTHKKGTTSVDKDFLESLDRWRTYLAVNISWNNKTLEEDEINFAVQQTIDRIIFLRIAEDRSVEPYGNLKHAIKQGNLYLNLFEQFRKADEKYNSGLFDLKKDHISETLKIENKIIKTIINELYYPECPYEFSVLPVEILGSAYEQFLGKVIRITPAHHAKIEEKPEVRKAGGVYYTPQYIVEYIVKNTVGKILEGKTPKEISKIKIVDPACGSGSFLIGAYQYLLNWHKNYYSDNGKISKGKKDNPLTPEGNLTTAEKKRILLNNIFGVDIDINAVEVTKLSLLLKCLEGETEASIQQQFKLWNERVLPTLENNIKSGNSLIDTDFFDTMLDFGEERKIKPFNWQYSFPDVFLQGGFDIVIGNPPYGASLSKDILAYLINRYPILKKVPDSYCAFIYISTKLVSKHGLISFIVPNTFCDLENCDEFRKWFLENNRVFDLYQTGWAFKEAVVDTLVFIMSTDLIDNYNINITVNEKVYERSVSDFLNNDLQKIDYRNQSYNLSFFKKMLSLPPLSDFAIVKAGVKLYERGKGIPPQTEDVIGQRIFTNSLKNDNSWLELYRGENITNYHISRCKEYVNYGKWLAAPRSPELFASPKILMRRTDDKLKSSLEEHGAICVNSCHVIKLNDKGLSELSYKYLLALLNSSLIQKVFEYQNPQMIGKIFSEIKVIYVERLPIKSVDFKNSEESNRHDKIVNYVDQLIKLKEELESAILPDKIEQINTRIEYTKKMINKLVFEVYGLTDEEKFIVEMND
jgi:hypothetical protein